MPFFGCHATFRFGADSNLTRPCRRDQCLTCVAFAGLLQGSGGISVSFGKGSGDSDEDIVVRIKAEAPVLKLDEPIPVQPVL